MPEVVPAVPAVVPAAVPAPAVKPTLPKLTATPDANAVAQYRKSWDDLIATSQSQAAAAAEAAARKSTSDSINQDLMNRLKTWSMIGAQVGSGAAGLSVLQRLLHRQQTKRLAAPQAINDSLPGYLVAKERRQRREKQSNAPAVPVAAPSNVPAPKLLVSNAARAVGNQASGWLDTAGEYVRSKLNQINPNDKKLSDVMTEWARGDYAKHLEEVPWGIPAVATAAGLSGFAAYKGLTGLADKATDWADQKDLEKAEREFSEALADAVTYKRASEASPLALALERLYQAEKQANKENGLLGTSLAIGGIAATPGLLGSSWGRASGQAAGTYAAYYGLPLFAIGAYPAYLAARGKRTRSASREAYRKAQERRQKWLSDNRVPLDTVIAAEQLE